MGNGKKLLKICPFLLDHINDTDLYNDVLNGWEKHSTKARASSAKGSVFRTENIWINPAAVNERQNNLFSAVQCGGTKKEVIADWNTRAKR